MDSGAKLKPSKSQSWVSEIIRMDTSGVALSPQSTTAANPLLLHPIIYWFIPKEFTGFRPTTHVGVWRIIWMGAAPME